MRVIDPMRFLFTLSLLYALSAPALGMEAPGVSQDATKVMSKEESSKLLPGHVKDYLDIFLRLYHQDGLIEDFEGNTTLLSEKVLPDKKLYQVFRPKNIRNGWNMEYSRKFFERSSTLFYPFQINVNSSDECINSRAAEGYLSLPFIETNSGRSTRPYYTGGYHDRHTGVYLAKSKNPDPDHLGVTAYVTFVRGCAVAFQLNSLRKIQ